MTEDVKKADGAAPKKLSLQRRTKTTVSTTAGGKAKEVQVEVRKNVRCQQMRHKKRKKQD